MPQVVILAGGLGTRLKPVTEKIPKVMIEVAGKPFLEHQLEYLKKFGFRRFLILVSYLREQILAYFQSGEKWGVEMDYSEEKEPMGTGGALRLAYPKLDEQLVLLNGDTFYPLDYADLLKKAEGFKNGVWVVVYNNREKVAPNNVQTDTHGNITAYSGRNPDGMNGVDGGVYFVNKSVVELTPEGQKISLEEALYPALIRKKQLKAYWTATRYYDMGTFERLDVVKTFLR